MALEKTLLSQVIGHKKNINRLLSAIESKKFHSTHLFVGPSGVGKKQVAMALVQKLVCENKISPCGNCGACIRIVKKSSESLIELSPDGVAIKLEQARDVQDFCALAHHGSRAIVIDQADKLNLQAANSLLKVLEEPPKNTYFFLIAPSLQSVLKTIRSRSQVTRFGLLSPVDISRKVNAPAWALESAGGRMDLAAELNNDEASERRNKAKNWLEAALKNEIGDLIFEIKNKSESRSEALNLVRYWREFLRDIWFHKQGLKPIIHADIEWDKKIQSNTSVELLSPWSLSLEALERDITGSVDVSLSIERFLRGPHVD